MLQYKIERRLNRLTCYNFIVNHPEFYQRLQAISCDGSNFEKIVKSMLPADWLTPSSPGIWANFQPAGYDLPQVGFKIHLSAHYQNAETVISRVVPVLVRRRVAFKVLWNEATLAYCSSNVCPKPHAAKFITVYPRDLLDFKLIIAELAAVTCDLMGPRIMSDRSYQNSKIVYYRFGAYKGIFRTNIFGEKEALIRKSANGDICDIRTSRYILPEGVQDPFESINNAETCQKIILNNRYEILSALSTTSKGGVFLALDRCTNGEVVIKQARPFMMASRRHPFDARDFLRNEKEILEHLMPLGLTPKCLAMFECEEDLFLVIEKLSGKTLPHLFQRDHFNLLKSNAANGRFVEEFCRIIRNLLASVLTIHQVGVSIGDIAPQNILFDENSLEIKFIDFESSQLANGSVRITTPLRTLGISDMSSDSNISPFQVDFKSLANLARQLVLPSLTGLEQEANQSLFKIFVRDRKLPDIVTTIINQIESAPTELLARLNELQNLVSSATVFRCQANATLFCQSNCEDAIAKIANYIIATYDYDSNGNFPCDYRMLQTNSMGLFYGSAGLLLFLVEAGAPIPDKMIQDLISGCQGSTDLAAGIATGMAGISWALASLGRYAEGEALMVRALAVPTLKDSPDLFYGIAGVGMVCLQWYQITGRSTWLDHAMSLSQHLVRHWITAEDHGLSICNIDNETYHGLGHGPAGVALFFLRLYELTQKQDVLDIAVGLMAWEMSKGLEVDSTLIWTRSRSSKIKWPYYRLGSIGVALVAIRFFASLGDSKYLDLAQKVAENVKGLWTKHTGKFGGMSGIGELFVELWRTTGDRSYRQEAGKFAEKVLLHSLQKKEGISFLCSENLRVCNDFSNGSAGVGLFLIGLKGEVSSNFFDLQPRTLPC